MRRKWGKGAVNERLVDWRLSNGCMVAASRPERSQSPPLVGAATGLTLGCFLGLCDRERGRAHGQRTGGLDVSHQKSRSQAKRIKFCRWDSEPSIVLDLRDLPI